MSKKNTVTSTLKMIPVSTISHHSRGRFLVTVDMVPPAGIPSVRISRQIPEEA
jgi:hypothetical protein